ncbi:MAG: superoxide dismutase [Pseudomonadota bacterium]
MTKIEGKTARLSRREFVTATTATIVTAASTFPAPAIAQARAPYALPPLPYSDTALAPVISAQTMGFHYGRHHKGYVDNINRMVQGDPVGDLSLEELIKASAVNPNRVAHFNNAAMVWNHSLYWNSLKPGGGGPATGALKDKIDQDLGGYDKFKADFAAAANGQFGSGWAWLIADKGKLAITRTGNADTPLVRGAACLLVIDVWEHAYYLDYQNRRADYTAAVIDKLLNWDFANEQFAKAPKS